MDVKALLSDLGAHNVKDFEGYGIKVSFHSSNRIPVSTWTPPAEPPFDPPVEGSSVTSIDEIPGMSQSIDGELAYDKVLNWSASPDASEPDTPLTGDSAPLTNEG